MLWQVIAAFGYDRLPTVAATVDAMLSSLHGARELLELQQRELEGLRRRGEAGELSPRRQHETDVALQLAQQTLLSFGSSAPLRTGVRDRCVTQATSPSASRLAAGPRTRPTHHQSASAVACDAREQCCPQHARNLAALTKCLSLDAVIRDLGGRCFGITWRTTCL